MAKIALVFSGQGAQYPGMGKELYECSAAARAVFEMADAIRPGTSQQCFTASKEELSQTINTQPCLFCVDLAAALAVCESGIVPDMAAGFSLGELAALAFSGILTHEQAFRLVCKRAQFMQNCAEEQQGAMLAVLGLQANQLEAICSGMQGAYPANYNCPGQTVVSCLASLVPALTEAVTQAGGKVMRLAVNGAFHSPFMAPAAKALAEELAALTPGQPTIPLYANATAQPYGPLSLAANQVDSPVLWQQTVEEMHRQGAEIFIEAGPGKTLTGLIKKILSGPKLYQVQDEKSLRTTQEELACCKEK